MNFDPLLALFLALFVWVLHRAERATPLAKHNVPKKRKKGVPDAPLPQ